MGERGGLKPSPNGYIWSTFVVPRLLYGLEALLLKKKDIECLEIRLFADDCVCYREIKDIEDTLKLQKDIDRLGIWARKWGMRFQPVKCNMMQLT